MPTPTEALLVSVYIGEDARIHGRPVYMALLELLRDKGAIGVTVVRGVAGIDTKSRIHSAGVVSLAAELPMKIEWVDTPERVDAVLPEVKQLVGEGLITVQEVTLIKRPALAKADVLNKRVASVMSADVVSVETDTRLADAVSLLLREGHKSLPVVDRDHRVVGIVTDGDMLRNTSLPIRLGLHGELTPDQVRSDIAELQSQARLVGEIMTMPVVTVPESSTIRQAGARMVKHDLKRLPVVDEGGCLVGIISRVDVLRAMHAVEEPTETRDQGVLGNTIADLMNVDAPKVTEDADLEEIVQALERSRQQRVVVVDAAGRVIGLITDGDLLRRSMYGKHPSLRRRLRGLITGIPAAPFDLPAGNEIAKDLMTAPAVTIGVDDSLSEALSLMLGHQLKRLPVVDGDRKLVGVLGRSSVLRGLMHEDVPRKDTSSL